MILISSRDFLCMKGLKNFPFKNQCCGILFYCVLSREFVFMRDPDILYSVTHGCKNKFWVRPFIVSYHAYIHEYSLFPSQLCTLLFFPLCRNLRIKLFCNFEHSLVIFFPHEFAKKIRPTPLA